ncbi:hypothetical protein Syun_024235 [Stephania yunnanensis]|uniref:Uncharacterized protein n=1 Tax=Stephania yunnanensis TaxID=152371 RepID=A0AAP0I405_9MAGN
MKKKSERDKEEHHRQQQQELEILKAVAQAWHAHSGSCRTTNEFEANRRQFKNKPTRFKAEASKSTSLKNVTSSNINGSSSSSSSRSMNWDFGQSLWDSYEIVTVSKRLEETLVLDDHQGVPGLIYEDSSRVFRRRREK